MARPFSVRRQRGFTTIAMICFAALYLPIFVLVVFAFNSASSLSHFEGVSLRWFVEAAQNQQVVDATILSFKVASIAAIACSVSPTYLPNKSLARRTISGCANAVAICSASAVLPVPGGP